VIATTDEFGAVDESLDTIATLYVQAGGETITMAKNETLIMYSETLVEYAPVVIPTEPGFNYTLLAIIGGSVSLLGAVVFVVLKKGLIFKK